MSTDKEITRDGISQPANADHGGVSNIQLGIYALPSLPIAFLFLPVAMMMPAFYASTLEVSLATVGTFLLISRSLDVVLDPMIGKWSDATRSNLGRRKLWMLIGTPFLMVGAYLLFIPPESPTGYYLLIASFVIYLGGSTVGLPYSAWGTEIVETYHGRSRMAGFRETAAVLGGLAAASVPAITGLYGHGIDRFTMSIMGWMIIVLTPVTVLIAITMIKEPPIKQQVHVPLLPALKELYANFPFRILCGAYILFNLGNSVIIATMAFFVNDYLKEPTIIGQAFLLLSVTTIVSVPVWLKISRKIGKHRAISLSLFLSTLIFGTAIPWVQPGQANLYLAIIGVLGIASAGFVTLPLSIIGDVIDYDTLKHGNTRGGIFWGVWSFSQKATPALGIGLTLPLLKYLGFSPGSENTPEALMVLKYTYCFGGLPFLICGGLLLLYYPIDNRRHKIIRNRLEARALRNQDK